MNAKTAKRLATAIMLAGATVLGATARDAKDIKIYINPGHGGHDADDRNVVIAPYTQGDPNGYWESNSNLSKGLQLRDMLEAKGYTVVMSRTTNTSEDDLALSKIVSLSNSSGADLFFSIHSNATGTTARRNFPLMLFRGYDDEPVKPNDKVVCQILNKYLLQNGATYWTSTTPNCRGDWSFYKSWGTSGLGVLRNNTVTAMLSEGSFHDYIPEAYRLMSDDFCWIEAWHFRKTVDEYFGVPGIDKGAIAGRINDTRVPRDGDYIKYGDDKLATIQGATVELLDSTGKVLATYNTDKININGIYLFKDVEPGTYTVRASVDTHYTVESEVTVVADEITFKNLQMSKVRSTPPVVESYSPVWSEGDEAMLCNTPITIQFNWDMDTEATEKAFKIEPAVEGTFTWEDLNYRMVFTPTEPYEINTKYTVTVSTDAKHAGGMNMESPVSFSFLTTNRNFMEIIGSFPKADEAVHYENAVIEFRFDKFPNVVPILKQVTCTDSQGNAVAFNSRKMSSSRKGSEYGFFRIPFTKSLTVGETYTLNVSGEFADKDGITIKEPVQVKFHAVDAAVKDASSAVIDDMDDATAYAYQEEGSLNVEAASATASTDKLFGTGSVALDYTFKTNETGEVLFSRTGSDNDVTVTPNAKVFVHVNGDLTNNELYLEMTGETATQYVRVCSLDFLGWRYIEVPATLEGVSRLTGIKIVQNPSLMSKKGTIYVDEVLVDGTDGVDDVTVQGLTISMVPGSDYLVANADCLIMGIELVGVNGQIVARTSGNALNVSEILAGTYVAVVHTGSATAVQKVAIIH